MPISYIVFLMVNRVPFLIRRSVTLGWLTLRNHFSRKSAIAIGGPVVCMTSYGMRINSVHLALESIAAGSVRPSRVILWLDDDAAVQSPTPGLRRLIRRGLEVAPCADDGPHKKYYPYVQSVQVHTTPLVTADDDWLFPLRWLEALMRAHAADPTTNTTHRARRIMFQGSRVAPYELWPLVSASEPSTRNMATGGWGHVLVPRMLEALRDRHEEFRVLAPRADDVWLHRVAVETGTAPKVVGLYDERQVLHMPIGDGPTLSSENVDENGNDRQIQNAWPTSMRQELHG